MSHSLYGVATLSFQLLLTRFSRSLRSAGVGYGTLLSESQRSSSVSCHLLYAETLGQHDSENTRVHEGLMCVDGLRLDGAEASCDVAGHHGAFQRQYLIREGH